MTIKAAIKKIAGRKNIQRAKMLKRLPLGIKILKQINQITTRKLLVLQAPLQKNIGDNAIMVAEKAYLEKYFPEVAMIQIPEDLCSPFYLKKVKRKISPLDCITLAGGGFLGTMWPASEACFCKELEVFRDRDILVFPQTVYFSDDEKGRLELEYAKACYDQAKLTFFVREKASYDFVRKNLLGETFERCYLVPDIVLSYQPKLLYQKTEKRGVICCFRNDREKSVFSQLVFDIERWAQQVEEKVEHTDMLAQSTVPLEKQETVVMEKLQQFAQAKLVITDRLHCMIFCVLAKTCCIALNNKTKKVEGVYNTWLKKVPYVRLATQENLIEQADELLKQATQMEYELKDFSEEFIPLKNKLKESLS